MLATWHWHIEISSKCTLKCPRCARQECQTKCNSKIVDEKYATQW